MKKAALLSALVLFIGFSCQTGSDPNDGFPDATSEVTLAFPVSADIRHLVVSAEARVSATDMDTIVAELTVTDDAVEGIIEDIPAGADRHFEVFVYDENEDVTYYGNTNANVIGGETIVLNIVLYPQGPGTGTVIINGTFGDTESGLVAYWPFSGNADDISGNSNHGINYGATLSTDRFGNPQSAYSFTLSAATRIEVEDDDTFDFGLGDFTISGWVKTDMTLDDPNGAAIIDKYPQNALPWTIRLAVDGRMWFLSDSSVYSQSTINDNVWHHFVALRENGTIKLLY